MKTVYIASCVKDGGIHRYHMDRNGHLTWQDKTPMDRPMYMSIEHNKMYIVLRAPFLDCDDSGVISYDILPDGSLDNPSEIISTRGQVACHVLVNDGEVYCANYITGSVVKLPDILVEHHGKGPNQARQDGSHVHYVGLTPDKQFICAVDLGLDSIFLYDKQLNRVSQARVPNGHGARHITFSEDGKYMFCVNELASTVSAFYYEAGCLDLIDTVSALPDSYSGFNLSAAIRVCEGKVLVSNRGHDSVSVLTFNERLNLEKSYPCGGHGPRDFLVSDEYLIITNENSNNVCVRSGDAIVEKVPVPAPVCVVIYS